METLTPHTVQVNDLVALATHPPSPADELDDRPIYYGWVTAKGKESLTLVGYNPERPHYWGGITLPWARIMEILPVPEIRKNQIRQRIAIRQGGQAVAVFASASRIRVPAPAPLGQSMMDGLYEDLYYDPRRC